MERKEKEMEKERREEGDSRERGIGDRVGREKVD